MLNSKGKIVVLQEAVKHASANGMIHDAVLVFKDNKIVVDALGVEDKQGVVDGGLTAHIEYTFEVITPEEVAIGSLPDLLDKLELFERNDEVTVYTTAKNELVVERTEPRQVMTYELADKKYIKSYPQGDKVISWKPITLRRSKDGKEKTFEFSANITIEANILKEYGKKISKIKVSDDNGKVYVPVQIKDGKLTTVLKGETASLLTEVPAMSEKVVVDAVETIKILSLGTATSKYGKELLDLISLAHGKAKISMSDMSPVHIHYEYEGMSSDYMLRKHEEN